MLRLRNQNMSASHFPVSHFLILTTRIAFSTMVVSTLICFSLDLLRQHALWREVPEIDLETAIARPEHRDCSFNSHRSANQLGTVSTDVYIYIHNVCIYVTGTHIYMYIYRGFRIDCQDAAQLLGLARINNLVGLTREEGLLAVVTAYQRSLESYGV